MAAKCTREVEVEYKAETNSGGDERRLNEACESYMYERRSRKGAVNKALISRSKRKVKASIVR